MASLKEAQRSAALAFSPNASYLAAGTVAGFDSFFSTSSTLEVSLAYLLGHVYSLISIRTTYTFHFSKFQHTS